MVYVYVIRSKIDERDYIGITNDIRRRLVEHNSGKTKSTKAYTPWKLLYFELRENYKEARKREKYLKSGFGKHWIKNKERRII